MEVGLKDFVNIDFQRGLVITAMALMWITTKLLWVTGKTTIMDSSLYVLKVLIGMLKIGVYCRLLVKKFRNQKTVIYRYEINAHCFKILWH